MSLTHGVFSIDGVLEVNHTDVDALFLHIGVVAALDADVGRVNWHHLGGAYHASHRCRHFGQGFGPANELKVGPSRGGGEQAWSQRQHWQ